MNEEVTVVKEKGNSCLKDQKYEEAILHYSHAIKLDSQNHSLYSNRSLAFLKIQQYYLALEDAKETIRLKPDWAKGYFRKAEVEYETFNYNDALLSYKIALTLQPNDPSLENAIKRTKAAVKKEKASDDQIPWIGAAIGIFVGAGIVIADQIFTHKPILGNPIIMLLMTFAIAIIGYFVGNGTRFYLKSQRSALLYPPVDLFDDIELKKDEKVMKDKDARPRYSKAQLRQRLKKGRS
ncbi:hypothetical protein RUM43_000041 [Polyplax serrata]|uniref:Uncharacterized protein n=1 Tax=Polyplax serrata TaxID=468196 RepID=A0AAN8XMH7_POLSC